MICHYMFIVVTCLCVLMLYLIILISLQPRSFLCFKGEKFRRLILWDLFYDAYVYFCLVIKTIFCWLMVKNFCWLVGLCLICGLLLGLWCYLVYVGCYLRLNCLLVFKNWCNDIMLLCWLFWICMCVIYILIAVTGYTILRFAYI